METTPPRCAYVKLVGDVYEYGYVEYALERTKDKEVPEGTCPTYQEACAAAGIDP